MQLITSDAEWPTIPCIPRQVGETSACMAATPGTAGGGSQEAVHTVLLVASRLKQLGGSKQRRSARRGALPVLPTELWIEVLRMLPR